MPTKIIKLDAIHDQNEKLPKIAELLRNNK